MVRYSHAGHSFTGFPFKKYSTWPVSLSMRFMAKQKVQRNHSATPLIVFFTTQVC
jgi:hypothetical protein